MGGGGGGGEGGYLPGSSKLMASRSSYICVISIC